MKVIDLLNKIANGEEVPEKIKYDTKEMKYDHNKQDYLGYYSNGNGEWLFQYLFDRCRNTEHFINDEVEIIEEDKKIEKVNTYILCDYDFICKDDDNNLIATNIIDKAFEEYSHKINEIIDKINEME